MTDTDIPITLKEACEVVFRNTCSVSTLRAEAERGNLDIAKIGKRFYTTLASSTRLRDSQPLPRPNNKPLSELMFLPGGIYVVGFDKYVKIGWSNCIEKRIAALQLWVPAELKLYAHFDGEVADERRMHRRYAEYRTRGEWFRREGRLGAWINGGCI